MYINNFTQFLLNQSLEEERIVLFTLKYTNVKQC